MLPSSVTAIYGLTGFELAGWFALLVALVSLAGYLAGSASYFFGSLLARTRSVGRRRMMWMHFILIGLLLGYYSHVFLPVLLVSAHSAWLYQRSRRIRMEKKRNLLVALARLRARAAA